MTGLQQIDINVTVSLQEKGGIYQAVLSYKDITDKWKTKWKSTGVKAIPGNKKEAKAKADLIRDKFEVEMIEKLKPKRTGIEVQLDMEFIDFMNMRLEEVNIKRKYEYDTYVAYKSNINVNMKKFFGSSKDEEDEIENDSCEENENLETDAHGKKKNKEEKKHIYKVCEITPELIDDFFTFLSVECKLKNTSIKHYRNQISVAYELLDKKQIMTKPTKGIEELKDEVFTSEVYTMEELNKLLEIMKDDVIEIPVMLAAYYGLRRSEAVGLKWSAIDFENNFIYINHTVVEVSGCANKTVPGKLVAKDRTKSIHSNRKLPLYKEIKAALIQKKIRIEWFKRIMKGSYNTDYLEYVCVKDDGSIIKPNHITHRFLKILRRNGLKIIRYHDLRHTLGTELNANGVDLKSIGEFLGHGNLSTTKRYSHPDDRIKQNVANTYSSLIHNGKKNPEPSPTPTPAQPKRYVVKRKISKGQLVSA